MIFFFWLYFSVAVFLLILSWWHHEYIVGVAAALIGMRAEIIGLVLLN